MKIFLFLAVLIFAASARGQSTLVVTSSNYPSYPVGSTNVPISLDSGGRMILSAGSGVAMTLPVPPRAPQTLIAGRPAPPKVSVFRLILSLLFP